jgi:hypothetical protein
VRALITTWLELGGLLLLVSAVVVLVWPHTDAGAIALGGIGLIGTSAIIELRSDDS